MTGGKVRHLGELALPGAGIGATAGVAAGGLALLAGQPIDWALATAVGLGLPLVLLGGGFGLLLAAGRVSPGVFAPAALYWFIGFPIARVVHEMLVGLMVVGRPALPPDLLGFLAYQAIVSLGFAIGFSWIHERLAPGWLRRIRHHNPAADRLYGFYLRHAEAQWKARESRRQARAGRRAAGRPTLLRAKEEA